MRLSSEPRVSIPKLESELRDLKQDPAKESTDEYAKRYSQLAAQIQTEKQLIQLENDLQESKNTRLKRESDIKFLLSMVFVAAISLLILYLTSK
jgi:uncharacterized FAD-dependent dehydrogenase